MRYELTDYEWAAIRPMLPNKARGVRRVDDRGQVYELLDILTGLASFEGRVLRPTIVSYS
jgi:transposase